jgi:Na+-transporting methylmalonyl-CoA/oxaloacetate decarboxylase beta subunit
MNDFILYSIIGSVVLTCVLNVLPMLFPRSSRKIEEKIHKRMEDAMAEQDAESTPRVKVFFPWKIMLIASIVLTIVMNLVGMLANKG